MPSRADAAVAAWLNTFYPYQLRWIGEDSDFAVCNKSRQIGISHANAGGCVIGALIRKRPQIILSASQDLSDEVLDKVHTHAEVLAKLGYPGATDFVVDSATEIRWRSGGRVVALPANPRTARSFTGDVWLDEAAYFLDPEGIRDAAFPMAMRGGWRVRVVSTPNGAAGMFYDLVSNPSAGWVVHTIPVDVAIADGLALDRSKLLASCGGDDRLFAQWFQASFIDADLQYLPTVLVDQACAWKGTIPSLNGAEIYAGLDVGRHQDLTALTIVALMNGVAWVLAILTCKRTDFRTQKKMIADARDAFQWETLHVDKSGLGEQLTEELVERWGDTEVRPVSFTNDAKADMATRLYRWLRRSRVRYPHDAEGVALKAESIALRRKVTAAGNIQYEVPRSKIGHGDRLWSLCLALKGAGDPPTPRGMGDTPILAVA